MLDLYKLRNEKEQQNHKCSTEPVFDAVLIGFQIERNRLLEFIHAYLFLLPHASGCHLHVQYRKVQVWLQNCKCLKKLNWWF